MKPMTPTGLHASKENTTDVAIDKDLSHVAAAKSQKAKRMGHRKGIIILAVLSAGAAWVAYEGVEYVQYGRFVQTTDNAYLKADFTSIAPKVSGYIREVLVHDNDQVIAGQTLARIDDRDFQTKLSEARADLRAAKAAVANVDAQIDLQHSLIDQARAVLAVSQASQLYAAQEAGRSARLKESGVGSLSLAEQRQSQKEEAEAAVARDKAALVAAENRIPVLVTQRDQAVAQLDRAEAVVRQRELDLSYTEISSAIDGTIGARTLRVGQFVASGTQLLAVVPLSTLYVIANFKETELAYVEPGQLVEVRVDALPGAVFKGLVDSIAPASGVEFSLLPTDNATGNFTKIVQRIPVRISLGQSPNLHLLRSGMSVVPTIDIRTARARAAIATEGAQ